MIPLRWHLRQWTRTLRWQGLAGSVLVVAAVVSYFAAIDPARTRIRQLKDETQSVRASRSSVDAAKPVVAGREPWLQQFYGQLPPQASAPEWLRILFSAASAHSLRLERGQYKLTVDKSGQLLEYEIVLPVRGNYVQIRKFLADALEKIPAAALDEITIKREAIGDSRINASIRFTLFLIPG
jgi:Tfp pilus assembly protein PilO